MQRRLCLIKAYLIFYTSLMTLSFVSTSFNLNQFTGMTGYFYGFQLVMYFLHLYFLYIVCVLLLEMRETLLYGPDSGGQRASLYAPHGGLHPTRRCGFASRKL